MSKGSKRRPAAVPPATVDANYTRTFTHDDTRDAVQEVGRVIDRWVAQRAGFLHAPSDRTDAQG